MNNDIEEIDISNEEKYKQINDHIKNQFRNRYKYLIGEWNNRKQAKSTVNGKFVSIDEVINYLKDN